MTDAAGEVLERNDYSGNVRGAIGDGAGIVVDAVAAMFPFVPGGVGYLKAGQGCKCCRCGESH